MPNANVFDVTQNNEASTYTTFSGSDIKIVFGNYEIGNLQGLSLSVNREVRPVFVMGQPDAISYSRGKRGIAGSMIFTMFDRQALYDIMQTASYIKRPTDMNRSDNTAVADADWSDYSPAQPYYSDQIPPFDVTLVGVNEFGNATVMKIFGVHLISEGTGISVDDTVQETQMTFVAKQVDWWKPVNGGYSTVQTYNAGTANTL